jgi:acetyl/propionyl-CoA carboxylase alpha subunit
MCERTRCHIWLVPEDRFHVDRNICAGHCTRPTQIVDRRWFKSAGDPVALGEPLVEIDTDSITNEILSPATGVLSKILVKDGDSVEAGTALGTISQF